MSEVETNKHIVKQSVNSLWEMINSISSAMDGYLAKYESLEFSNLELKEQLDRQILLYQELNSKTQELNNKIEELVVLGDKKDEELHHLKSFLDNQQDVLHNFEYNRTELIALQQKYSLAKEKLQLLSNASEEMQEHKENCKSLRININELERENELLRNQLIEFELIKKELVRRNHEIINHTQNEQDLKNDIASLDSKLYAEQKQNRILAEKLRIAENQFIELKKDNQTLFNDNRDFSSKFDSKINDLVEEIESLNQKNQETLLLNEQLNSELITINDSLADASTSNSSLAEENENLKKQNEELKKQNEELKEELASKQFSYEEQNSLQEEYNSANELLTIKDNEISSLKSQVERHLAVISSNRTNIENLYLKISEADTTLLNTEKKYKNVVLQNDKLAFEKSRADELINELQLRLEEFDNINSELEDLKSKNNTLHLHLEEFDSINSELEVLKSRNNELFASNEQLEEMLAKNTYLKQQLTEKEVKVNSLSNELTISNLKIEQQQAQINNLEKLVKTRYEQINILEEQLNKNLNNSSQNETLKKQIVEKIELSVDKIDKILEE
jgi:golgin subfamily B member 1